MKKIICIMGFVFVSLLQAKAQIQPWKFAHISDTHIGSENSVEDLQRTVKDINANPDLQFVIITGDLTEFGSDEELKTAKELFSEFNKPWYVIPGNHDMKWSESGGNSFTKVFGSETVAFEHGGFLFLGTNCGPNMRMGPGQVPRENIVWLDSVLNKTPKQTPIIFLNHYPQDSSLCNWYEIIDRLKTHNTQLIIFGHWHSNHHLSFEGIPAITGRSNLRANAPVGGYNIVTIKDDSIFYNERIPGVLTKSTWAKERLYQHDFSGDAGKYPRPSYTANQEFNKVKVLWSKQDVNDIGAGTAITGKRVIVTNSGGWVTAYDDNNGKKVWATKTGGKIYSTPCISGNNIVVASTDNYLYCMDRRSGNVNWKFASEKPMVASPVIVDGYVFCGSSDGHFRCLELSSGKLKWDFNQVKGFIETRPLFYNGLIYFGSWGNHLYALDQKTGALVWNWYDGATNRMFSPAACVPVAVKNRLFIVAPDNYMTCFDAANGNIIWRKKDSTFKVRESMGLSADSSLVYIKTMAGNVLGINANADTMEVTWKAKHNMHGYDICPSPIVEHDGIVFALSDIGSIYAFKREDGSLLWIHKLSNSLVNPISFLSNHQLIATTMDGNITCLQY